MSRWQTLVSRTAVLGGLGLVLAASGCGYAKREMVESELARVREEMRAGDEAVLRRVAEVNSRVDALERDLQALRGEFNVTVQRLEGLLSFNVPVHFDFDSSEVREQDRAVLDRFAAVVKQYYPNALVTVEGFTDPAGSAAYNLRLGMARAESVKAYLTSEGGLEQSRVRTVSYGKAADRLVAPGAKGPGSAGEPNRRVALVIDYSGDLSELRPTTE